MNKEELFDLLERYSVRGRPKGSDFLLPPGNALCLARDLSTLGAAIAGCYLWAYVDRERGWIKELVGEDLWVKDHLPWAEMTPETNLQVVEDFLAKLPKETDFVSFMLVDSQYDAWFVDCTIETGVRNGTSVRRSCERRE